MDLRRQPPPLAGEEIGQCRGHLGRERHNTRTGYASQIRRDRSRRINQHRDIVAPPIRCGQVQVTVAIQVTDGDRTRIVTGPVIYSGLECAVPIAQEYRGRCRQNSPWPDPDCRRHPGR